MHDLLINNQESPYLCNGLGAGAQAEAYVHSGGRQHVPCPADVGEVNPQRGQLAEVVAACLIRFSIHCVL